MKQRGEEKVKWKNGTHKITAVMLNQGVVAPWRTLRSF